MNMHAFDLVAGFLAMVTLALVLFALASLAALLFALWRVAAKRMRQSRGEPSAERGEEGWLKDFG